MTIPPVNKVNNVAKDSTTVGFQAQAVHGNVRVYQVPPGATAEDKFHIGVRCLTGGMPDRARNLIDEAVAGGYTNSKVRFYWILALLSGRTLRQMTNADISKLRGALTWSRLRTDDEWTAGLRMIQRLLAALETPDNDVSVVVKEFDQLGRRQHDAILRHLELFLDGPVEDQLWRRAVIRAENERARAGRKQRAWIFFQPEPVAPRLLHPEPVKATAVDRARLAAVATAFLLTMGYLVTLAIQDDVLPAALALMLSTIGALCCIHSGVEWIFRVRRLRAMERGFRIPSNQSERPRRKSFTRQVDRLFEQYSEKYAPPRVKIDDWLKHTRIVRWGIRNEIVHSFRDSKVSAKEIAWLIRYRLSDVRRCWEAGTLDAFRTRLRVGPMIRLVAVTGCVALGTGTLWLAVTAMRANSAAAVVFLLTIATGWISGLEWLRTTLDRRRFAADLAEAESRLAKDRAALDRWRKKLEPRPTDAEMASWLDCDRKILMEMTMNHYKLAPSDVIANAFIEAPARPYKRGRVSNGPWRYSRYRILVFLLTQDGVRQMTAELDFENILFPNRQRTNYRFDAVASVRVADSDKGEPRFELTLVNGEPIDIQVSDADVEMRDDSKMASEVTLDAAGLKNTLHVLEGIAAEGKEWINHEGRRSGDRITVLRNAVDCLLK